MKRSILKTLCIVMMFAVLLTMGGCASDEERIIGTWKAEVDCKDWFMESFMEGSDSDEETKKIAEYIKIDSFKMTLVMTFNEDGTYSMGADPETVIKAMEGIKEDVRQGMENYLSDMFEELLGEPVTGDDLKEFLDPMMEEAFGEKAMNELVDEVGETAEGRYKIEDGKIYISEDKDTEPDRDYDTYKLSGDKLTLLECFCEHDDEQAEDWNAKLYPLEFRKEK